MAVWGNIVSRGAAEDAKAAVRCALRMRASLKNLNAIWRARNNRELGTTPICCNGHRAGMAVGELVDLFSITCTGGNWLPDVLLKISGSKGLSVIGNLYARDCFRYGRNARVLGNFHKPVDPVYEIIKYTLVIPPSKFMMLRMDYIVWQDDFCVGSKLMDEQHKTMFSIINQLYDELEGGRKPIRFKQILDHAVEYANKHFNDEEEIMKSVGFTDFENHRKLHDFYKVKINQFAALTQQHGLRDNGADLLRYLKDWWKNHVVRMDKGYSAFFGVPKNHGH